MWWKGINGSNAGLRPQIRIGKKREDWCRRGESNPRPRDYETLALPLSYAGMKQFFMLRTRPRTCQGMAPSCAQRALACPTQKQQRELAWCYRDASRNAFGRLHRKSPEECCLALRRGQYQTLWYHSTVDPYRSKTYPARDRTLSHLSGKRKLIETMGREDVYRFDTGSSPKLLDIGVLRDRLSPGLFHPSEAQCHANSRLYCSQCSFSPGQWV